MSSPPRRHHAARALALELFGAEEALSAAVGAASRLLSREPPLPACVETDDVLQHARTLGRSAYAPHGWPLNVPSHEARRHAAALYGGLAPPLPTEREFVHASLHAAPQPPCTARAPQPPAWALQLAQPGEKGETEAAAGGARRAPGPGEMPPMPPGWKPGDPLPAFAPAAAAGVGAAEKAEELRYVPRVQLDSLNPDMDEVFEEVVPLDDGGSSDSD